MAGINEFLIFDENNQNTLSNESYSIDTQRLNGVGGAQQDLIYITKL